MEFSLPFFKALEDENANTKNSAAGNVKMSFVGYTFIRAGVLPICLLSGPQHPKTFPALSIKVPLPSVFFLAGSFSHHLLRYRPWLLSLKSVPLVFCLNHLAQPFMPLSLELIPLFTSAYSHLGFWQASWEKVPCKPVLANVPSQPSAWHPADIQWPFVKWSSAAVQGAPCIRVGEVVMVVAAEPRCFQLRNQWFGESCY